MFVYSGYSGYYFLDSGLFINTFEEMVDARRGDGGGWVRTGRITIPVPQGGGASQ